MNKFTNSLFDTTSKKQEAGMMRKKMAKPTKTNNQVARTALESLHPDALKMWVRDGLASMKMADRENFIQLLEREMSRSNLTVRAYLIPLGIPAHSFEELTPTEIGHLIRFLKMIVPQAMPAVERVAARYAVFAKKGEHCGERPAA